MTDAKNSSQLGNEKEPLALPKPKKKTRVQMGKRKDAVPVLDRVEYTSMWFGVCDSKFPFPQFVVEQHQHLAAHRFVVVVRRDMAGSRFTLSSSSSSSSSALASNSARARSSLLLSSLIHQLMALRRQLGHITLTLTLQQSYYNGSLQYRPSVFFPFVTISQRWCQIFLWLIR